jgi:hypothetical protein
MGCVLTGDLARLVAERACGQCRSGGAGGGWVGAGGRWALVAGGDRGLAALVAGGGGGGDRGLRPCAAHLCV